MYDRKIFLIRHAEPLLQDHKKRFIGQTDLVLSLKGIFQAQLLGEVLRQEKIQHIYTSPLQRALQTADIIGASRQLTPIIIPELSEIHLGKWEGRSFEEIQRDFPQEFEERGRDIAGYRVPEGESFEDLYWRGIKVLQDIAASSEGNVVLVGHKGINRAILCAVLEMPLRQLMSIPQDYGCINALGAKEGKLEVLCLNSQKNPESKVFEEK